jgi:hypothetical protein
MVLKASNHYFFKLKMKKDEIVKKNLDLMADFMKYAFDKPEILDSIPKNAHLVLLPTNNPELYKENMKTLHRLKKENQKYAVFKIESVMPKIELLESIDFDESTVLENE